MDSFEARPDFQSEGVSGNLNNQTSEIPSTSEVSEEISDKEFSELLENSLPFVKMICFVMLKNVQDKNYVQDMVQEVMIKAFVNRKSLRSKSNMESWLSRITRNACIDYIRSKKVGFNNLLIAKQFIVNPKSDKINDQFFASPEMSIENKLISNEEFEIILSQLSPSDSALAIFVYKKGLSLKEIIEETGYNENTLKVKLLRMRKRIRKILMLRREIVAKRKKLLKTTDAV